MISQGAAMIRPITKQYSKEEVLDLMEDLVRTWFDRKFKRLTEPQAYAVPLIHRGENVIVSSPTGSGKTLTAFLSIINELYRLQRQGQLEDKIYCLYVSPLKALANDINKNLNEPLREMDALARELGLDPPRIKVAVRSGDTSSSERQRQSRRPPHIFITTPESLAIVLSTPIFSKRFRDVQWVILDEIHEVCSNKRGVHLSLSLERLREQVGRNFLRIGLSATIAPMEEVAKFLAGYENGQLRPMNVVEVETRKRLDMRVLCPVRDMTALPFELVNARMYDLLKGMVSEHRTTLVFTNTRSGTEHVSFKLKERGVEDLEAHHGSLSKYVRLDVEDKLKSGKLKAVICSTSLELGIDIGYIDLVCQIGSPKSIAKGLQRIGRAGHAYGGESVGRLIVFDNDDLLECAALVKGAYENSIDRVDIPGNSLDVLAQSLVGMSLEKRWGIEEAYELVRRSYCYRDLPREDFMEVLRYLSSRNPDVSVYAKIWLDEEEGRFGRKRGSRMIYFTNVGTIPEEGSYHVYTQRGVPIGELSEKFVEYLSRGDVFVLGGRTYQFERIRGMTVYVKDASGRRPTVPSWTGEMLPRSFDLSFQVGALRKEALRIADDLGEEAARRWLVKVCRVDEGSARSAVNYLLEQQAIIAAIPSEDLVLIEGYIDMKGNRNVIFHYCFGRRTNDALARAYAFALSNALGCNARISVTDDNFMVTVPRRVELEDVIGLVKSADLEDLLRRAVRNTELFKQRFRHCATRSFMVLRNYRGHDVSVGRQQLRSQKVLDWLHELENFPVIKETYNEILNEVMDIRHAKEVLTGIEEGRIRVHISQWSNVPSPLAHNVVLLGISDIVLMEDRSALLRELHRQVLKRVVPEEQLREVQFTEQQVEEYFRKKVPWVDSKRDIPLVLEKAGALNLLRQKGSNIYDYCTVDLEVARKWCEELVQEGKVASVWIPKGILWCSTEEVPTYAAVYARRSRTRTLDRKVLDLLAEQTRTAKDLSKELKVSRVELNDSLRRLERSYEVARTGLVEPAYTLREVEPEGFERALDRLVLRLLGFKGPLTLDELAYELDLKEDIVREVLNGLENEGMASSGHFVVDEGYQYMLSRDLRELESGEEDRPTLDDAAVRGFLQRKQFRQLGSIEEYFELFLEAGMIYDIFQRVKDFSMDEWYRLREDGEIIEGRFLAGRVRYVKREDAPLFASAYRRTSLGDFEKRVLEVITGSDGLDMEQIASALREERARVKEAVDSLDRSLYIIRKFTGTDAWTSKNTYIGFNPGPGMRGAREEIIKRFLKGYGPSTFSDVKGYTGFPLAEVEQNLDRLVEDGIVTRILVRGKEDAEMYLLTEELEELSAAPEGEPTDRLRILSLYDPWIQPMWAEVTSRYGEGWIFPVVKDGVLAGMVEKWQMSGCIEIREVELKDPSLLPELLSAIQEMMAYYRQLGYEIVRITRAFGKPVTDMDSMKPFLKAGYHLLSDFLAWGDMVPDQYTWEEVFSYVFYKQGLHPQSKFRDVFEALEALGSMRSDFEAMLKVRRFTPLEDLFRKGFLARGLLIPDYWSYCTEEDLELYKAAKAVPLDEEMEEVLEVLKENEPISKARLMALSPLPYESAEKALRRLYKALYVTRDPKGRYRSVGDAGIEADEARRRVLRRIVESFGIFSAENLGAYTRFRFNMAEVRSMLRELEREGILMKGFLVRGEPTVFWALRDGLLGKVKFEGQFILTPQDNLSLYLRSFLQQRWRMGVCYATFDGPRVIAAFKARRKGDELVITDFEGDSRAREMLRSFSLKNDVRVREDTQVADEWEVIQWYERMYGGSRTS
ncbi:MAG: ATP-dependent helicase [Thermoplasmata archaeon]